MLCCLFSITHTKKSIRIVSNVKYQTSTNRTLHKLASINKYRRYFTNRAKVEYLGFENFYYLCENSGSRYTNEYQFATALSNFVSDAVVGKSVKLLKQYGLKVF